MAQDLKVALFSDSHYEVNGVARTTNALEQYGARRGIRLLSVHAGPSTRVTEEGSTTRLEIKRWGPTSFGLEHDLHFDVALWRYAGMVAREIRRFGPDVLHFTGPSDIGQIGAFLGRRLGIPMVGSWHTNLHEYASRRLRLPLSTGTMKASIARWVEDRVLHACVLFYKMPRVILAPNQELLRVLSERTGKPVFLMSRGVDTELFTPAKRRRNDLMVHIGYVGRLSREKNVRALVDLYRAVHEAGQSQVRFTVIGDGSERKWLQQQMPEASFPGILLGEALASAYADMDVFAFPSETETVGNVALEAMASGVAVVAMACGGPKFAVSAGPWAALARDRRHFVVLIRELIQHRDQRRRMGLAARARAIGMSWDRIFDDVYQAYGLAVSLSKNQEPAVIGVPRTSCS